MKIKKSDVNILIMLAGILIAVAVYFLVYAKLNDKTDVLNTENASLQKEVDELQDLADHRQQYIDDTATMLAEIDEIKAQFPAEYRPEDDILYVLGIEKEFDASASDLGMGSPAVIEVAAATSVEAPAEGESVDVSIDSSPVAASPEILLYRTPLTVQMISSYNSIKDIIKRINTDQDRKSIEQITLSFDSDTGDLTVALSFNAYSLSGTEKIYSEPDIGGIKFGTGNIFNSAEKKQALQAAKQTAAEGADAEGADAQETDKEEE